MKINRELLKGSITLLVLQLLREKPMYGYQIIQEAKERSKQAFELNEGTLYPVLHALETEGSLEGEWGLGDNGRKRKYYRLTTKGRQRALREEAGWNAFTSVINLIVKESRA